MSMMRGVIASMSFHTPEDIENVSIHFAYPQKYSMSIDPSIKTSASHPLRIDTLDLATISKFVNYGPASLGQIGLTFCPGKCHRGLSGDHWRRDLDSDIALIRDWGADVWLNLMENQDLLSVGLDPFGFANAVENTGMVYYHLPIVDGGIPDQQLDAAWHAKHSNELLHYLRRGRKLLIHCRGGLGRTGMIAARLLVDMGCPAVNAIALVRQVRPGAIENQRQEVWAKGMVLRNDSVFC